MTDYARPALAEPADYRPGLFAAALALTLSVFPLIWMGGLVTSQGVGLSVPDWPNSYGYNMVLFPPSKWLGGIFYEHTHRLLGTLSGFLAIVLMLTAWAPARYAGGRFTWSISAGLLWLATTSSVILALGAPREHWFSDGVNRALPHVAVGFGSLALVATFGSFCRRRELRRWVRWLTVAVFAAVCVQGTLGGLRVDQVSTNLAIVHGCFAQAFFSAAAFTTLVTSRWWVAQGDRPAAFGTTTAFGCAAVTVGVIAAQLVVGALQRHNDAGLAIPGVLVYGHLLPPTDQAGLDAANQYRVWTSHLPPTDLTRIWLHFLHRVGALCVTVFVVTTAAVVFQNVRPIRAAGRTAAILLGLLATQVTLGVLTVYHRKPADIASLHVAVGALTLMAAVLLTAVLARQTAWRRATATAGSADGHSTPRPTRAIASGVTA